jgi:hypothetical protein
MLLNQLIDHASKRSPDERSDIRGMVHPRISLRSCGLLANLHRDLNELVLERTFVGVEY